MSARESIVRPESRMGFATFTEFQVLLEHKFFTSNVNNIDSVTFNDIVGDILGKKNVPTSTKTSSAMPVGVKNRSTRKIQVSFEFWSKLGELVLSKWIEALDEACTEIG
ncbi:hypothetical protein Tco_0348579 [Tanacetum coccineum]